MNRKKAITATLLLMLCCLMLYSCGQSIAPPSEEFGSVTNSKQSHILVDDQPIPYIMRASEERTDAELAADFASVIAVSEDLAPVKYEKNSQPKLQLLGRKSCLKMDFGEFRPISVTVYSCYIGDDGSIRFPGRAGGSFARHESKQFRLVRDSRFQLWLKKLMDQKYESGFGETAGYIALRMVVRWSDKSVEYMTAYRIGIGFPEISEGLNQP